MKVFVRDFNESIVQPIPPSCQRRTRIAQDMNLVLDGGVARREGLASALGDTDAETGVEVWAGIHSVQFRGDGIMSS